MDSLPIKLTSSINYDDAWVQDDCHWKIDRVFELTWKVSTGNVQYSNTGYPGDELHRADLYYRIGEFINVPAGSMTTDYYKSAGAIVPGGSYHMEVDEELSKQFNATCTRKTYNYTHTLYLSTFTASELQALIDTKKITIYIKALDTTNKTYTTHYTLDYNQDFAPVIAGKVEVEKLASTRFKCSWPAASSLTEESPVNGYCIEILKKSSTSSFKYISDLYLEEDSGGRYWVKKKAPTESDLRAPTALEGEDPIVTFYNQNEDTEVYLSGKDSTTVYFNPENLGILKDDQFKVIVYPYTIIGTTDTYLAGESIDSGAGDIRLGIVRIKTAAGWKEGQVWVKTSEGWKEAIGVYTKTDQGWKESI
jgi:hypothetical protein